MRWRCKGAAKKESSRSVVWERAGSPGVCVGLAQEQSSGWGW